MGQVTSMWSLICQQGVNYGQPWKHSWPKDQGYALLMSEQMHFLIYTPSLKAKQMHRSKAGKWGILFAIFKKSDSAILSNK